MFKLQHFVLIGFILLASVEAESSILSCLKKLFSPRDHKTVHLEKTAIHNQCGSGTCWLYAQTDFMTYYMRSKGLIRSDEIVSIEPFLAALVYQNLIRHLRKNHKIEVNPNGVPVSLLKEYGRLELNEGGEFSRFKDLLNIASGRVKIIDNETSLFTGMEFIRHLHLRLAELLKKAFILHKREAIFKRRSISTKIPRDSLQGYRFDPDEGFAIRWPVFSKNFQYGRKDYSITFNGEKAIKVWSYDEESEIFLGFYPVDILYVSEVIENQVAILAEGVDGEIELFILQHNGKEFVEIKESESIFSQVDTGDNGLQYLGIHLGESPTPLFKVRVLKTYTVASYDLAEKRIEEFVPFDDLYGDLEVSSTTNILEVPRTKLKITRIADIDLEDQQDVKDIELKVLKSLEQGHAIYITYNIDSETARPITNKEKKFVFHASLITGIEMHPTDPLKTRIFVKNSWGEDSGHHGYIIASLEEWLKSSGYIWVVD